MTGTHPSSVRSLCPASEHSLVDVENLGLLKADLKARNLDDLALLLTGGGALDPLEAIGALLGATATPVFATATRT